MIFEIYIFQEYDLIEIEETKSVEQMIRRVDQINKEKDMCAIWRINLRKAIPYKTIRKDD